MPKDLSKLKLSHIRPGRKMKIFSVCLLISAFIWFTRELSKDFNTVLTVPVEFVGLPDNLALNGEVPNTIMVNVNAHGFNVFGQNIRGGPKPIEIFLGKLDKQGIATIDHSNLKNRLQASLSSEVEILSFSPESFTLTVESVVSKIVVIRPRIEASYENPYFLSAPPYSIPDSVSITGPASVLDSIHEVQTELVSFDNLSKSIKKEAKLLVPVEIESQINQVSIGIEIDQWTEKSLDINIVPYSGSRYSMRTFPNKTTVTFLVGLKSYNLIAPDLFVVEVEELDVNQLSQKFKISLEINKYPGNIKDFHLSPAEVEFILVEKQQTAPLE